MKTSLQLMLTAFAFVCCILSHAQTQMRNFVIPPKKVDVSGVPQVTNIASGVSVTREANGIFDANNNLMFYGSDNDIYKSGSSTPVSPLGDAVYHVAKNEIAIVPFMDNDACGKKNIFTFHKF